MRNNEIHVATEKNIAGKTAQKTPGPKYEVNIEGQLFEWENSTITVPELRELGHLPTDLPVLLINLKTNEQRTLDEDEIVELKPGMGFSKKTIFKRG